MDGQRREDWQRGVDENLASLNAGQRVWESEQAAIRKVQADHDRTNRELVTLVNVIANQLNKYDRIFDKDYLGHGGLVSFITYVYEREKAREEARKESRGYKWAFWGMILAAVIGAGAVVLTNKEQIEKWWTRPKLSPLEQKIERAKHPKGKKIVHVHVIKEDPDDDAAPANVP